MTKTHHHFQASQAMKAKSMGITPKLQSAPAPGNMAAAPMPAQPQAPMPAKPMGKGRPFGGGGALS